MFQCCFPEANKNEANRSLNFIPTPEQLEEARKVFSMFDRDGDGFISVDEFRVMMFSLGGKLSENALRKSMAKYDADGSESIDFDEFLLSMDSDVGSVFGENEHEMVDAFKVFDRDVDGFISPKELKVAMAKFGEALSDRDVVERIKAYDLDGDGKISYREFKVMMSN